ncbi:MAG: GerW family sporulation protein [Clostridiales bacterium]|nr:GerW family sporulation protein [Lachnospiraceae bacterium]MCD7920932.1 GerW family sporulation protein [Clostridiales bacterium]MCD8108949.1 GerW family sporulation protein [Clostridiales bacterium]MCD8132782.1 GerW family sporulation protein [Clostridiales bacterium]
MADTNGNGNSTFQKTVDSLMQGMDGFVSTRTVVGDPIYIDDTILLPLVDVSFGMAAGAFIGEKKKNSGGGMGGKISPSAVLVIRDGVTRMVSVKNQDSISKILDMIPDFVNKFMKKMDERKHPEEAAAREKAREEAAKDLKEKLNMDE